MCGDAWKRMYLSPMMQHFFNNIPIEEPNAVHHPGALRKVSTYKYIHEVHLHNVTCSLGPNNLKYSNMSTLGNCWS